MTAQSPPKPADPNTPHQRPASRTFLVQAWNGEVRLWEAYWLIYILGLFALFLALRLWEGTLFSLGVPYPEHTSKLVIFTIMLVYLGALVPVWRCARNARSRIFTVLARAQIVVLLVLVGLTVLKLVIDPNWKRPTKGLVGAKSVGTQCTALVCGNRPNPALNRTGRYVSSRWSASARPAG